MSIGARIGAIGVVAAAAMSVSAVTAVPAAAQAEGNLEVDGSTVTFTFHNGTSEPASCFAALQYFGLPLTQIGLPPVTLVGPSESGTLEVEVPLPGIYRHVSACLVGDEYPSDPEKLREHLVIPLVTNTEQTIFGDAGYIVVDSGHLMP
ncbi:hypothetical protein [Hoyosella altamirensis]|uniref:Uncharacterized protein n=1 Tax=Hoyosella altamirensis TaxID=616997 RepID=A0A839RI96_9ACTN|nr:hypothetical protein [Hoyosella altamirensis]MBB3035958.1 hypothetical protein [Hoyosella altamirensis]